MAQIIQTPHHTNTNSIIDIHKRVSTGGHIKTQESESDINIYSTTNGNWSCEFQAQSLMDEATDSGRMEAIKRD